MGWHPGLASRWQTLQNTKRSRSITSAWPKPPRQQNIWLVWLAEPKAIRGVLWIAKERQRRVSMAPPDIRGFSSNRQASVSVWRHEERMVELSHSRVDPDGTPHSDPRTTPSPAPDQSEFIRHDRQWEAICEPGPNQTAGNRDTRCFWQPVPRSEHVRD